MACSPFDIRDYLFGELSAQDAETVREHLAACTVCREELDRLKLTQAALLSLRDEEMPRRIAFVSDKVFEPNWWNRVWQSGARLGFASAAILAVAILVHAFTRPAPVVPAPSLNTAQIETRIEAEVARRLPVALADLERRQKEEFLKLVAETERRIDFNRRIDLLAVDENFKILRNHLGRSIIASNDVPGARP